MIIEILSYLGNPYVILPIFALLIATVSSVSEWFLHAKILHGKEGTEPHKAHSEHHAEHQKSDYKKAHTGEPYGVALPFFIGSVAMITLGIGLLSLLTRYPIIITIMAAVISTAYFMALEFVHQRVHEPKPDGWFEKTALYAYLDRAHRVHHARDDRNFSIVLPDVGDRIFGTLHRPAPNLNASNMTHAVK